MNVSGRIILREARPADSPPPPLRQIHRPRGASRPKDGLCLQHAATFCRAFLKAGPAMDPKRRAVVP